MTAVTPAPKMPTGHSSGAPNFEAATAWRKSQVEEYSAWEAATDIYVGNALAYKEGDPVPASNVIAHEYDAQGLVRRPEGWTDPVPGDAIEDEPVVQASGVEGTPAGLDASASTMDTDDDAGDPPAKSADLPTWQEYALRKDKALTAEDLQGVTKKELQERYGQHGDTSA